MHLVQSPRRTGVILSSITIIPLIQNLRISLYRIILLFIFPILLYGEKNRIKKDKILNYYIDTIKYVITLHLGRIKCKRLMLFNID